MADYDEIYDLFTDPELLTRTEVAVVVEADVIRQDGAATEGMKNWARAALNEPKRIAKQALRVMLAMNKALTVAQIKQADDTALQSAVHSAIPLLAGE